MSRGDTPSRSNPTPLRGNNSNRQSPGRTRHGNDQSTTTSDWEGSKSSGNFGHGYPSSSSSRNQHKNHSTGSNSSSNNANNKSHHDMENQSLLDKFEALGRARRGDTTSASRVLEDTNEPEWLDPTDDNEMPVASKHSIQEFEEWKAKMKADEKRRAGLLDEPALEEPAGASSLESKSYENFGFDGETHASQKPSIDRSFGMWDGGSQNDHMAALGRASRFSRFFKGDSAPSSPVGVAPPGLSAQNLEPADRGSPASHMFMPVTSPMAQASSPVQTQNNDADKEGFNRIMAMLGDKPGESAAAPSAPNPPSAPSADAPPSDDAFFMSLLNKGGSSGLSLGPSSAATSPPVASTRSPIVSQTSSTDSRGITPAVQSSQQSFPDGVMARPQKGPQFPMDPYFSGPPPPEWIQQQISNGQFPANGPPPPGFIPPPFMGMPMPPPPGMMPQFPPGQNGMPPLPPHMMPPPGGFYNGPPPPMNFPMQHQQPGAGNINGQFPPGPPGMQMPPFGMHPKAADGRFDVHKVN